MTLWETDHQPPGPPDWCARWMEAQAEIDRLRAERDALAAALDEA